MESGRSTGHDNGIGDRIAAESPINASYAVKITETIAYCHMRIRCLVNTHVQHAVHLCTLGILLWRRDFRNITLQLVFRMRLATYDSNSSSNMVSRET